MELKKGVFLSYKNQGICQIMDFEMQELGGEECLYCKLKPIAEPTSTYFVPVSKADSMLRELLSAEEILSLIDTMGERQDELQLPESRKERRDLYSRIMKSADSKEFVRLMSTLFFRKIAAEKAGKKLSSMDESILKNAERIILQEFGYVLGMEEPELRQFIDDRISS